jgi:thiosulfate/3-mercaptopyruvate sulfurtransferase
VFYEDALNSGYGQSCRGYYLLTWLGYPKVKVLNGGYSGLEGRRPAPSAPTPCRAGARHLPDAPTADVMLTKEQVLAALGTRRAAGRARHRRVDRRELAPYGKDFAPRKGRLPGAKWIEWYRFMKPSAMGPQIKSPLEVQAECATAGIAPTDTVYLYCFKGARASNTFLALKQAGFTDVRMYFGSWNEWSRDPALPIETAPPGMAMKKARAPQLAGRPEPPPARQRIPLTPLGDKSDVRRPNPPPSRPTCARSTATV